MLSRVLFLCLSDISFLMRLGVLCLSCCLLGGVYTLWSVLGILRRELYTLGSLCNCVLEWGRSDTWVVGLCNPLMVVWHGTECTRLRWICGSLGLGRCLLREFICWIVEYFCQCFDFVCVTDRMVCLLVLQYFKCLNEIVFWSCGCITWCFNGDTTVLWVQFLLARDTDTTCGYYLGF